MKHPQYSLLVVLSVVLITTDIHTLAAQELLSSENPPGALWFVERQPPEVTSNGRSHELTGRIGPNMRASTNYHDFTDIQPSDSVAAWSKLENQLRSFGQSQVSHYQSKLDRLLLRANVSHTCRQAARFTMESLYKLESWAFQSK